MAAKGLITEVTPEKIAPGSNIVIYCSYQASSPEGWHGWQTRLVSESGNLYNINTNQHWMNEGNRSREPINLKSPMPDYNISIRIRLEAMDSLLGGSWQVLDTRDVIIQSLVPTAIIPVAIEAPYQPVGVNNPWDLQPTITTSTTGGYPAPPTPGAVKTFDLSGVSIPSFEGNTGLIVLGIGALTVLLLSFKKN